MLDMILVVVGYLELEVVVEYLDLEVRIWLKYH
jgi:hypothetical protein